MLETKDLILDKTRFSDWEDMYRNVWRHPECAKYMAWRVTENDEEAKIRIQKTIEFQKTHDTYMVYEKASREAIGFAGVEQLSAGVFSETGICLGPDYQRRGYGRQILQCLIHYCKEQFKAKEFIYSTREANAASKKLACSLGFTLRSREERADERNGQMYLLEKYSLTL